MTLLWMAVIWRFIVLPGPGSIQVEGFWPQTAVGWLTFGGLVVAAIVGIYGYAKAIVQVNGLGGRVTEVEKGQAAAKGREEERDKLFMRMQQTQSELERRIGEAHAVADECNDKSTEYFQEIGVKLTNLMRKVDEEGRLTHGRLTAIETELRLRNQALPLYIEKK